jgi:ribonuclease HI
MPICQWETPPPGYIKVNSDASYFCEKGDGAFGFVVRDENGVFLAAGAGKLDHLRSALHGEATACVLAMEATASLGSYRVIFESDSINLVNAITKGGYDLADTGVLMREARSLRSLHFDHAEFRYCRRECNKVAHCLAKYGYQASTPSSYWMDVAPDCVIGLVASDIAGQQF